ncbi:threonyl-tRNA synthetase [Methanomicrobium sp. W14]|uniref:threonyl-tRNA synthetase editing domain-containing protein n=1 Tax=Methanomicrobium sp. W14 TaxID=2817839 RepID=UPI001AE1EBB6|nr:threonyl-tRNA synthetase editing domain-containing protein [Methanomicrobium sp. W14]MBP2134171.1 threonyl-tRNA synthetase [Methanomicrobium sp. W14]
MRIVFIHVDYMRYRAVKRAKSAGELEKREGGIEDGLVLFSCAEKEDEINPEFVVKSAVENVIRCLDMIGCRKVMIYPYAHLTPCLSTPETAVKILKGLEEALKREGVETERAVFGWYKELEMKSNGHPLADLSMMIRPFGKERCDFHCPFCGVPVVKEELVAVKS